MCGIIGYLGNNEAAPILVDALRRLEYRGYDSAGIATLRDGELGRRRAVGKLVNLSDALVHSPLAGKTGIGHTRWATHGPPTEANAHPHQAGTVSVVHNGIIENFRSLKLELEGRGYRFETETDTETVAVMCRAFLDGGSSPSAAALSTVGRLDGAFALCFLFSGHDDLIFAARRGSPLVIGHGTGEMFVASDAIALSGLAEKVTYLEEGDCAEVSRSGAVFFDDAGRTAVRSPSPMPFDSSVSDKSGYKHYMAKEIFEQPKVLSHSLGRFASGDGRIVRLPGTPNFAELNRVNLVACGTAYLACKIASYWFAGIAKIPAEVSIASEFRYRELLIDNRTLSIFVSQSGETADTLAALRYVKQKGLPNLGILNNSSSSMARECENFAEIGAGVEIGVASTKAFTCQLATLALLSVAAGRDRNRIDEVEEVRIAREIMALPGLLNAALATDDAIRELAEELADSQSAIFIGRGTMFPLALEGALKLKEISYIHAEGFPSGELKHGPIALVDKRLPVIVCAPSGPLFEKTVSNIEEVKARGAKILLISDADGVAEAGVGLWKTLVLPSVDPLLAPILYAVPLQLLAYHTAVVKGTDVDQPRNLAKSVTVE